MLDSQSFVDRLLNSAFNSSKPKVNLKQLLDTKLQEYDLSKTKVIQLLGIDKITFEDIISGDAKQPTLVNVIKIAEFLGINYSEAIEAIIENQRVENIASIERARNATFIAKNFDIKRLSKIGFFEESDDINYLTNRILTFFGYSSVSDYERELGQPLFSKSKRAFVDRMKDFWIKSAYQCFKNIANPNPYDREAVKDLIPKIKPYCQDTKDGLLTVCKALYGVGITVVFQNHLSTTQVRGGTFVVDGKPCIVLTDLFKRYTTIWETLIHELYHVLYDLSKIEMQTFHLTGDSDLLLIEEKADKFAREYFCGLEEFHYISPHVNNKIVVERLAKKLEVHPSFVYSSFRYFKEKLYGENHWHAFNQFFPNYLVAVEKLKPVTWKEPSAKEIAQELKRIFEL